ncbi:hypothetical protein Tco_0008132 [Tanacetum coccineum]
MRRCEIIPYPKFTKIIINHYLSLNPSIPKGPSSGLYTIKDDGVISKMKLVRIGEDFQEYGRAILDTMLTEVTKQTEAYQTFIKYSTGLIPPKKSRGKGSQGKQQALMSKKKSSISVDDNIIPEQDVALELGKSMSLIEAEEEEPARRIYATHKRLVTESDDSSGEPSNRTTRRRTSNTSFRDTSNVLSKKSLD